MPTNHTDADGGGVSRRKLLKAVGVMSVAGIGSTAPVAASEDEPVIVRLKGTYKSPLSFEETRERLEKVVARNPRISESSLNDWAVPEFGGDHEIVEYLARIDSHGSLSQYYGSTVEEKEAEAHDKADDKEDSLEQQDVSIQSVSAGPDWSYIGDNQAHLTDHWGELNNNYERYRIRDSAQERNAFRTSAASTDDTINPYNRHINIEHDWSVSQLNNESLHDADPSTTGSGTTTASIGFPPSADLSWTFNADGDITQGLNNAGATVSWTNDIPNSGTSWFYPGSHVVSDPAHCSGDQDVVALEAEATWGLAYELTHTWNIHSSTC
ncbi:hypothetical protein [Halalkalicoccus tibetensis]|uniref:Uncharacterized protein n=1 Tax=Halalkalicoccus tibetensis TaxID=175632 RepID=A0ABD5V3V0_9EURY